MPVEAPNTLRSRARYKIIDVISQGPIRGLVNGAKSVYLDETPIQAADGTLNFKNFQISTDLQQLPIPDITGQLIKNNPALFPLSENEVSVGAKVTKDNPEGSLSGDGSITRTISDIDVDSVRVTMRVPALTTTNTTTGDITGGQISFKIEVKPDGGDFMPAQAGNYWRGLTLPNPETSDGATGIDLTVEISNAAYFYVTWQYRKKTGGSWGDWFHIESLYIPASSASSSQYGPYNPNAYMAPQSHTRAITGLAPGIYQIRAVGASGTVTYLSAREFAGGSLSIGGKTTSPYDADYIVQLPGTGPWDIKVSRISADPPTANIQGDLYWLSYTEQISNRFSWPNTAGVAITFDAEDFGGNIPSRAYDVMGLMVKIPVNYDPYARTYTGIWNGTFKTDWTDNPAWIFYDLLTNKRYGLGDNIDAAQIDKYALYQIAQYCDELVDAPNGATEPRYTCSCVINTQSEAYELLTAIASAFRGMIYLAGGTITATADMPSDPILNVGPANVIDGNFTYQGASRKSRHTVARVSWNNPDDGYKLNVELYEDDEAIRKYGYRPIDINAFGCTSRGLARRWGKWSVVSDNDAPDTVTYKAGFDHFKLRPGDVINIADPNYSGEQLFGLIANVVDNVSPATHTITLDRAVTRLAGDTSELQVTLADGTILLLDVAVLSNTTGSTITVDSVDLSDTPLIGASWLLKKGTVEPRQWRVISVSEDEPHVYQVTAMLYDPNKFDKVESDLNFAEADFTAFPDGPMPAPTGVAISEFLKQTGSAILACVNLSWTRPNDPRADWFEVQYQLDGEEWRVTEPNITQFTGIDILNIVPGTYNFRVRAQDTSGLFRSAWTTLASQELLGKDKEPENVTGFTAEIEKYGVLMSWNPVSDIDINFYEIRRGASWAAGTLVAKVKGTTYKWEDATEATYTFWIKAVDTNGNYSVTETSTTAILKLEAVPTVTAEGVKGGITVTIAGVTTSRFAHYEVQRKQDGAADGTAVTLNALLASRTWTDTTVPVYFPLHQYRVRAFNKNLNASAYSAWSNTASPEQIGGDDVSPEAIKQAIGSVASWSAKNCTTASIAEASGVKDVSGNANHGQAFSGVAVVDTEMGKAFRQSGLKCIEISGTGLNAVDRTFSCWIKKTNSTNAYAQILAQNTIANSGGSLGIIGLWTHSSGAIVLYVTDGVAYRQVNGLVPTPNQFYHVVGVIKGNVSLKLYIDGAIASSATIAINPRIDDLRVFIGGYSSTPEFDCFDPRVYNRALSETEVKSLYMFPGDVAFGRITSDLVTTGELITLAAQIKDATIGNAKITDLSAAKINAGTLDAARIAAGSIVAEKIGAEAITTEKLNVASLKKPIDAAAEWSAKGSTTASIALAGGVKDISGNNRHSTAGNGVSVVASERGPAFDFDGTNDYIQNPAITLTSFTVAAWFRSDGDSLAGATGYNTLIGDNNGRRILYTRATGALLAQMGSGNHSSTVAIPNGEWGHIVYAYNSATTTATWYINGAAAGNMVIGSAFSAATRWGAYDVVNYMHNGLIASPMIFSRAITAAEAKTLYMIGSDSESGTITADRVVTGQIKSLNYSTTAGSLIDLDSGDIKMGGSSAPRFSFTNSTNTGTFAGFAFNATDMTAGSSTTAIGISTDTAKKAFWTGSATPASAPFFVAHNGTGRLGGFNFYAAKLEQTGTSSLGLGTTNTTISIINTDTYSSSGPIGFYTSAVLASYPNDTWATSKMFQGQISTSTRYGGTSSSHCDLGGMGRNGRDIYNPVMQFSMGSASWYSIATNGKIDAVGGFSSVCDERMKKNIKDVAVLDKLKQIPVKAFELDESALHRERMEQELISNLKESNKATFNSRPRDAFDIDDYDPTRHINTMAAEFNTAFGTNKKSTSRICLNDQIGVALRAIQELAEIVDDQNSEIAELRAALNLAPKLAKEKPEIVELTDEEREYIKLSEELTEEQRAKIWADYEKDTKGKK